MSLGKKTRGPDSNADDDGVATGSRNSVMQVNAPPGLEILSKELILFQIQIETTLQMGLNPLGGGNDQ